METRAILFPVNNGVHYAFYILCNASGLLNKEKGTPYIAAIDHVETKEFLDPKWVAAWIRWTVNTAFLTYAAGETCEEITTEESLPLRSVQDLYPQMDGYNCGAFFDGLDQSHTFIEEQRRSSG